MGKTSKTVDFLKTAAIYALTVSMLTFAGVYINERQNAGQTSEIPWEKMRVFESGGAALAEINENHVTPVQITVTAQGKSFTAVYNDKAADSYQEYKSVIKNIFYGKSECVKLGKDEGDEFWKKCTEEKNSVYIKYAGNYIYPVIYIFLDKEWDVINAVDAFSGELATVHELFIIDKDPIYGAVRDLNGNVSVFKPEPTAGALIKSFLINKGNPETYNNIAGVIPCEFLKGDEISGKTGVNKNSIKNLKFQDSFHLFYNYNTNSSELKFSNPVKIENNKIDTEQDYIKDLFIKVLNFNIESSGPPYSDRDGITFVDGKNTVKFYYGGQIKYNGGIHLSKFLGYDADYYTFYEKIKAASIFVSSLPGGITGTESSLYLKDITADLNENLKVVFSYYYDGIEININGSDEGVVLTINDSGITEAKINPLNISQYDIIKNRNPILDLSVIDDMVSADINAAGDKIDETFKEKIAGKYKLIYDKIRDKFLVNKFELIYNINYADSDSNNSVKAAWEIR